MEYFTTVEKRPELNENGVLKLYFANMTFPPVGGPGVWRIMAMTKYAVLAGHQVTVFCADRASWHDRLDASLVSQIPEAVRVTRINSVFLRDITDWLSKRRDGATLGLMRSFYDNLRWRFTRDWPDPILHWALKVSVRIWWKARKDRPDCIVTTGPQHLVHLAGYVTKSWLGIPWIMDYRDPWTGFDGSRHVSQGSYQPKLFARIEQRLLETASAVTVVSPSLLEGLADRVPEQREKFHLIRNGHDLSLDRLDEVPMNRDPGVDPVLRIHFNGVIQTASDVLKELQEAVEELVAAGHQLTLSFCGLPPLFAKALVNSSARDCFCDLGPLEHAVSIQRCLDADAVLVAVSGAGDAAAGIIPGKTYEAMALGLHVLGIIPRDSDVRELLDEYGHATLSADNDTQGISNALQCLIDRFQRGGGRIPRAPESARKRAAWAYSREQQAEELLELVEGFKSLSDR